MAREMGKPLRDGIAEAQKCALGWAAIEHPLVRAATLTGSGPAGRAVAGRAGAVLKKSVLELSGSDPYLVLEDADLDLVAQVSAVRGGW